MRRTPSSPPLINSILQAFHHVGVVMLVGMVLATVFTAWTPGASLPQEVASQIANALDIRRVGSESTPVSSAASTQPPPPEDTGAPRIGIVAGHNGPQNDPGAVCPDGLTEASVNLDIATRVKTGLEANGFQVDLLNELDERLVGYKALAVVSIHNDSCAFIDAFPPATGFKVAGALDTGAPEQAARLVACLTDRYPKQTNLPFHAGSVTPDMTYNHTFYEVDASTPIAIIETGFLNLDRIILTQEPYRVAQGVIDGILCYVLNEPLPTPTIAPLP
jgi:N-acetylmuramoyl-L-alanine amidase